MLLTLKAAGIAELDLKKLIVALTLVQSALKN
jgi:hypothetical protein